MADKSQTISKMSARQKGIAVIIAIVIVFIVWQMKDLFTGSTNSTATSAKTGVNMASSVPPPPQPMSALPKPKAETMTPLEAELMKLQQETQAKYVAALNQLQMLKVEKDIAESQKDIMKAKQETVTAQKNIVDLLAPSAPPVTTAGYAQSLVTPTSTGAPPGTSAMVSPLQSASEIRYSVISVSQLQNRWSAVLGFQGNLYSVFSGDVLPPDGSKVVSISKSGVILEKNGVRTLVSMVPVI